MDAVALWPVAPCVLCLVLLVEYRELYSSGDSVVLGSNAWLDSGYMFCISAWRFWMRCSVSVLTQNGEVCSADASVYSSGVRCSHLEIWKILYEVHVAGSITFQKKKTKLSPGTIFGIWGSEWRLPWKCQMRVNDVFCAVSQKTFLLV